MVFQSEIRSSQVNELFERVGNRNYAKYLLRVTVDKARRFAAKPYALTSR